MESAEEKTEVDEKTNTAPAKKLGWKSRSVLITINHPHEKGFDHDKILSLLNLINIRCVAMVDEIGSAKQTYHTHIYIYRNNAMAASRLLNLFPGAHLDKCKGTARENRDYIKKVGTDKNIAKSGTQVEGTYYEWGDFPEAAEEVNPRMYHLVSMIKDGYTDADIMADDPSYALSIRNIHELREAIKGDRYANEMRDVKVTLVCGGSQQARIAQVLVNHDFRDMARCLHYGSYNNPRFDSYNGEDVLVLENFCGAFAPELLTGLMQGYPLQLPCRYRERTARYHYLYLLVPHDITDILTCAPTGLHNDIISLIDVTITIDGDGTITQEGGIENA